MPSAAWWLIQRWLLQYNQCRSFVCIMYKTTHICLANCSDFTRVNQSVTAAIVSALKLDYFLVLNLLTARKNNYLTNIIDNHILPLSSHFVLCDVTLPVARYYQEVICIKRHYIILLIEKWRLMETITMTWIIIRYIIISIALLQLVKKTPGVFVLMAQTQNRFSNDIINNMLYQVYDIQIHFKYKYHQVRCKMSGTLLLLQLAKKHKQASLDTETMLEPKGYSLFQLIISDFSPWGHCYFDSDVIWSNYASESQLS